MGFSCTLVQKLSKNDSFLHSKTTYFYPISPKKPKRPIHFRPTFLRPILHIKTTYFIFDLLCKKRPTFGNGEYVEYDQQDRVGQESGYPPAYELLNIAVLRAFLYIGLFLYRFIFVIGLFYKIGCF